MMIQEITEKEVKLLLYLRELGFGSVWIEVQRGEPVIIKEAIKTIKL